MKIDKFLLITVGALLVIILILLAMGGAAFLCLFVTNGPASNQGPLLQKNYDFNGTLTGVDKVDLNVHNIDGYVDVKEVDGDAYDISVSTNGTQADYDRYDVAFTQSDVGGVKTITVEIKDKMQGKRMINSRYASDITVTFPKNKLGTVELITVNGRVNLDNFTCGDINMITVNGPVSSSASSANSTFVTVNGNINVKTSAMRGDIHAHSVNGVITITVPKDAPVSLNAHLVNGRISSDVPLTTSEKTPLGLVGKTANYTSGVNIDSSLVNGDININTQ